MLLYVACGTMRGALRDEDKNRTFSMPTFPVSHLIDIVVSRKSLSSAPLDFNLHAYSPIFWANRRALDETFMLDDAFLHLLLHPLHYRAALRLDASFCCHAEGPSSSASTGREPRATPSSFRPKYLYTFARRLDRPCGRPLRR